MTIGNRHNVYLAVQGQLSAQQFVESFKEYPPSQAPASFTIDPEMFVNMAPKPKE
jgi:arylsulfatase